MTSITKPYTFAVGQTADPNQVNSNFDALYNQSNTHDSSITALQADNAQRSINVMYPPAPMVAAIGNGTTDDTTAIQNIINSASTSGSDVFLPNKSFLITATLTLKNNTRLVGLAGLLNRPNLIWGGAAGGTVISTVALSSNQDFWGGLENIKITYPCADITASTKIIYIARPYGNITGIYIQSSGTAGAIPAGSSGIFLDGTANVGAFNLNKCQVSVPVDSAYVIATNHANVQACECSGTNYGYTVQSDSVNDPSGPPYNVHFMDCHGFHINTSLFRIKQASAVYIYGGFNEGLSPGTAYLLVAESTFNSGFVDIKGPYSQPNRIQHYGTGNAYYYDPQDGIFLWLTGQSNGKPKVVQNLSRKLQVAPESGLTNGTDFTYQALGAITSDILVNPYGNIFDGCNLVVKLSGNFRVNSAGANVTFAIYSDTQPAPPGGSAPNATATAIGIQFSTAPSAGFDIPIQIALFLTGLTSNTHYYACAKTSAGTVTVNNILLTVETL